MTGERGPQQRGHESDQLPEEAPPEQVVEDAPGRRAGASESAGGAEDDERRTGQPAEGEDAAGG